MTDAELEAAVDCVGSDLSDVIVELEKRGADGSRVQILRDAFEVLLIEYQRAVKAPA